MLPGSQRRMMYRFMRYRYSGIASFFCLIFLAAVVIFFALYANSCYSNLMYGIIAAVGFILFLVTLLRVRNKLLMIILLAILLFIIYLYVKCPGSVSVKVNNSLFR
jgi:hypothetical protein